MENIRDPTYFVFEENLNIQAEHTRNYRSKLSQKEVPLQFEVVLVDKVLIYLFLWAIKITHILVFSKILKHLWKNYDIAYYWVERVHFVFFNIFFIDFFFFGTRAIYQSKNLLSSTIIAYITLQLIIFDIMELAQIIFDDKLWSTTYQRFNLVFNFGKVQGTRSALRWAVNTIDENTTKSSNELLPGTTAIQKRNSWCCCEYKDRNYLIFFTALSLRVDSTVFSNKLARAKSLIYIIRLSIYWSLIIASQISTIFILLILFALEILNMVVSIQLYRKIKHLRNIFHFILSTISIFFLVLFFFMCLMYASEGFNKAIGKNSQNFGLIWILISIIWEYVELIVNAIYVLLFYVKLRIVRRQQGVPSASRAKVPEKKRLLKPSNEKALKEKKENNPIPNNSWLGKSIVNAPIPHRGIVERQRSQFIPNQPSPLSRQKSYFPDRDPIFYSSPQTKNNLKKDNKDMGISQDTDSPLKRQLPNERATEKRFQTVIDPKMLVAGALMQGNNRNNVQNSSPVGKPRRQGDLGHGNPFLTLLQPRNGPGNAINNQNTRPPSPQRPSNQQRPSNAFSLRSSPAQNFNNDDYQNNNN